MTNEELRLLHALESIAESLKAAVQLLERLGREDDRT